MWEAEAGGSGVQGQLQQHSVFETSLDYMRPCVKKKKMEKYKHSKHLKKIQIKMQHDSVTSEVAFPLRKGSCVAFSQSKQPGIAGRPSFFTLALNLFWKFPTVVLVLFLLSVIRNSNV